ncbi:Predicted periplasmic solute-binding protein [Thermoproteus uzoniensis 768-20]|uniref:1,4-dihydroxy-6-naphtoate synthase n=1 Tax=Thermoproteus uzoniensis (strain 768-20) TaxID=999630 RepID=F2L285_THEU7|nr:MqnA/MqnD/SBP family protein [Thermoproteus uzoniensis]AEA13012.1 Predicted periplasmic solute-binding protein [Thermoproteus uzoniensis 768-20]
MELVLAHSPDADDAYMFYGIASGAVKSRFAFREFLADIETLNKLAVGGARLDLTALSAAALGFTDRYYVLRVGASMGYGYGPVVVAGPRSGEVRLVAVPGRYTTAALLLKLAMPDVKTVEVPFDKIIDAVAAGVVDAGILIHEGQITYGRLGLRKVIDLGEWWLREKGLPTPLGVDAVRKELGLDAAEELKGLLSESIKYAEAHREEALRYASKFSRGLPLDDVARFVDMYVNEYTKDMGKRGEEAVRELLSEAKRRGLVELGEAEFV